MTIFIDVLTKLIREALSKTSNDLLYQSTARGYNHKLSLDQKEIISALEESIIRFASRDTDEASMEGILTLLTAAHGDIKKAREVHGQGPNTGKTIACLSALLLSTREFHAKLTQFAFPFLNRPFRKTPEDPLYKTPENIVYFHACYYLGQEIFNPLAHSDRAIRDKKEEALAIRLLALSEYIKPKEHTLEEQRARTLQVLKDLARDNKEAVSANVSGYAIPGLTFMGAQIVTPSEWFVASAGRFSEMFGLAVREIEKLTPDTAACPLAADLSVTPQ